MCLEILLSGGGGGLRDSFVCLEEFETYFWSFFYVNLSLNFPARWGGVPDSPNHPLDPRLLVYREFDFN